MINKGEDGEAIAERRKAVGEPVKEGPDVDFGDVGFRCL